MADRSCAHCRFGAPYAADFSRCTWVDGAEDEAGDRMPGWAHRVLASMPGLANRPNDEAETCPAFEVRIDA